MYSEAEKICGLFLDMIFPIECLGCGENREDLPSRERWICSACLAKVLLRNEQVCPVCEQESEGGKTHHGCSHKSHLDGIWVAGYYEPLIEKAVHDLKFMFLRDISYTLGELLARSIVEASEYGYFQDLIFAARAKEQEERVYEAAAESTCKPVLVPVPLHRRRYNWRGFNQAALLARQIGERFDLPIAEDLVVRRRNTKPQTKTRSGDERRRNIANAFDCACAEKVRGSDIILVDDICTTSATIEECARVLKEYGARRVWGLVVARR